MKQVETSCAFAAILLFSSAGLAQPPVHFQSHYIGEPTADFLKDEPAVVKRLADCHDIDAHPDEWLLKENPTTAANEIDAMKHPDDENRAIDRYLYQYFLDGIRDHHNCKLLHGIFDAHENRALGRRTDDATASPLISMRWYFEAGVLSEMHIVFEKATFAQVATDMSNKLGKTPVESEDPYQNGFGATWNNQTAYWITPSVHAVLIQDNNPADQTLKLDIESHAAYDTKVHQQANRPNSLD
jgi:hypothetical protein